MWQPPLPCKGVSSCSPLRITRTLISSLSKGTFTSCQCISIIFLILHQPVWAGLGHRSGWPRPEGWTIMVHRPNPVHCLLVERKLCKQIFTGLYPSQFCKYIAYHWFCPARVSSCERECVSHGAELLALYRKRWQTTGLDKWHATAGIHLCTHSMWLLWNDRAMRWTSRRPWQHRPYPDPWASQHSEINGRATPLTIALLFYGGKFIFFYKVMMVNSYFCLRVFLWKI